MFSTLIQGMGVPLLLDVIRIVQPSHIIQFNYTSQENTNKNLPALTEDFLMNTPGWAFVVDDEKSYSDNQRLEELSVIAFCSSVLGLICGFPSSVVLRYMSNLDTVGVSLSWGSTLRRLKPQQNAPPPQNTACYILSVSAFQRCLHWRGVGLKVMFLVARCLS